MGDDMKKKETDIPIEQAAKREISCPYIEECKASKQVLYYLDECASCRIATKFRDINTTEV